METDDVDAGLRSIQGSLNISGAEPCLPAQCFTDGYGPNALYLYRARGYFLIVTG